MIGGRSALSCALLLLASSARAALVEGDADGFRFDLAPAGSTSCVIIPERLTVPADCEGVDLPVMRAQFQLAREIRFAAAIQRDDARYVVTYGQSKPPVSEPNEETARGFAAAAREATAKSGLVPADPARPFRIESYGPAKAVRLDFAKPEAPDDPALRSVSIAIAGESALHVVTVFGRPDVVMGAMPEVEAALSRVRVEPAKPKGYRAGRVVGSLVGRLLSLSGVVLAVVLLMRHFWRRGRDRGGRR